MGEGPSWWGALASGQDVAEPDWHWGLPWGCTSRRRRWGPGRHMACRAGSLSAAVPWCENCPLGRRHRSLGPSSAASWPPRSDFGSLHPGLGVGAWANYRGPVPWVQPRPLCLQVPQQKLKGPRPGRGPRGQQRALGGAAGLL